MVQLVGVISPGHRVYSLENRPRYHWIVKGPERPGYLGTFTGGQRPAGMGGDLPRQLSTQQRFILAYILVWSRRESEADPDVPFKTVSKATAIELDDGGTRLARTTEASGRLTSRHTSSFSRAVDSLEDRGLVEADRSGSRLPKRVAVRLTPSGRTTAEELLRRHHDGRYALEFRTLMSE